ncbi:hypothetical protein ACEN9X_02565 [Mucilaginibacter sp. Mucisp86]|uniref:hypothetical protein n=1 Tax=Mucilaginibacter sp. Mucisp86 TaxID=3243060 RepID=UPI0039B61ACF
MKLSRTLLLPLFIIVGCEPIKSIDNRPTDELAFVRKFRAADSIYSGEKNNIKKAEILEKQRAQLSKFITDTLHAKFNQWQAIVSQIEIYSAPTDYIEITLLITKDADLDPSQKYPDVRNIILSAIIKPQDPLKDKLKELLRDDKVLVTGKFQKTLKDNIVEVRNSLDSEESTFSNPKFDFKIEDITKMK